MTEELSEEIKRAMAHVKGKLIDKLRPEQLLFFAKSNDAGFESFKLSVHEITRSVIDAEDDVPCIRNSDVALMLLQFVAVSQMANELKDKMEAAIAELEGKENEEKNIKAK